MNNTHPLSLDTNWIYIYIYMYIYIYIYIWHTGHCWRSKDELISEVLLWTPTYGQAKAGRPARTYIQQLCEGTQCSPEDLPEVMNNREKWRERVRDIHASGTTWWLYIYIYREREREGGGMEKGNEHTGLVSLFNCISTFLDYLMPKLSLLKNSSESPYPPPYFCKQFKITGIICASFAS